MQSEFVKSGQFLVHQGVFFLAFCTESLAQSKNLTCDGFELVFDRYGITMVRIDIGREWLAITLYFITEVASRSGREHVTRFRLLLLEIINNIMQSFL